MSLSVLLLSESMVPHISRHGDDLHYTAPSSTTTAPPQTEIQKKLRSHKCKAGSSDELQLASPQFTQTSSLFRQRQQRSTNTRGFSRWHFHSCVSSTSLQSFDFDSERPPWLLRDCFFTTHSPQDFPRLIFFGCGTSPLLLFHLVLPLFAFFTLFSLVTPDGPLLGILTATYEQ